MSTLAAASTGEAITFWVLGPLAVIAAVMMVLSRNAVHAALFLAGVMLSLAGLYAAQDAPFLAAVQVIVYTGAVLMLFLFVLMLVGVDSSDSLVETLRGQRLAAFVLGLGFAGLLIGAIASGTTGGDGVGLEEPNAEGNVVGIARLLFTKYVFAFEVTSALLITAALGAMVLAHKEKASDHLSQRDRARARFAGSHPTPLPGPGVFALRDAASTPALLPDGSEAPGSVDAALFTPHVGDSGESVHHR
ncbi:MAG: NADH-quinone oxidoreductase subunit J [Actinobacteria bacterium]|nr:NADH-quinone oxidoreductase subunit J [Actinomycetota bacterium]MCA1719692.1 NADH-quinone oxidoreductase subunit J [Actinomycetota bacterium]